MLEDDVIRELWRIKDAHAARYQYDARAMVQALRKKQLEGGRKVVAPPRREASLGK